MDKPTQTMPGNTPPACDPAAAADARLTTWGAFELREKVGQGGFGEVYRAWDPKLQRDVAVKLLLASRTSGPGGYESMVREARLTAKVRHPNVVSVHGVNFHEGRVGFWTDFVRGKTLSALLAAQGPFAAREAAMIGIELCGALGGVHAAGLLHRDIKPGNVMREDARQWSPPYAASLAPPTFRLVANREVGPRFGDCARQSRSVELRAVQGVPARSGS